MYAIIKTGGKQYRVEPESEIKIEKLNGKDVGEDVTFERVLLVKDNEGLNVGKPFVDDAAVSGEIVESARDDKLTVFKYKKRKGQRRKLGHRQPYMKVKINEIEY
ncbi:50S ribosomal protein L21 [Candidatus Bipolaricaulota bacterium]|nr:50S ribosomal protein L21 [Candidatus Bipolaricaulota bacterium]